MSRYSNVASSNGKELVAGVLDPIECLVTTNWQVSRLGGTRRKLGMVVTTGERPGFRTDHGIAIQFLIAGQKASRGSEVSVSEPIGDQNIEQIEGLLVVRLTRLIEMKIACGMSNLRRT
ncbi:hypothetical protein SAMN06265222_1301, partial [Neorhodopirellula lusitana]